MFNEQALKQVISELMKKYSDLPGKEQEPEKRAEEFVRDVFEALGWNWLSREVLPQKKVRGSLRTTRVDFAFRRIGQTRGDFYIEVKRFSNKLDNPEDIKQALEYGKNGKIRCIILTNFIRWRVFNSDFFDQPANAEVFEFDVFGVLSNPDDMQKLMMFSRDNCGYATLEDFFHKSKHWRESADVEELLTIQLIEARKQLGKAILNNNEMLFNEYSEGVSAQYFLISDKFAFISFRIKSIKFWFLSLQVWAALEKTSKQFMPSSLQVCWLIFLFWSEPLFVDNQLSHFPV